jgi:tRNA-dihydrouridine synthase A
MIGRAAYQQPWRLLAVDPVMFGEAPPFNSPRAAAAALIPHIERELAQGTRLHAITRHLHGLFQGVPGARAFRRRLAAAAASPQTGPALLTEALALVSDETLDAARAAA